MPAFRKQFRSLAGFSSLSLAALLVAAPHAGFEAPSSRAFLDYLQAPLQSDLAKATSVAKTAVADYADARKVWSDRKAAKADALLKDDGFPKPFVEDPLKPKREAVARAKAALVAAIGAPATETDEVKAAKKANEEAETILKNAEATDKALVADAVLSLRKAMVGAIEKAVVFEDKEEEPELGVVRILNAGAASVAKLDGIEPRLDALPAAMTEATTALKKARAELKETHGKRADALGTTAQTELAAIEAELRTYLETQKDAPAAVRTNIAARRRIAHAEDAVAALKNADAALKIDSFPATASVLAAQAKALSSTVALVDDDLTGANPDWVQEAIPTFYFGSIPRLITALNLEASRFESGFFRDLDGAKSARKALLDNEDARDLQRAERNDLIASIGALRTEIAASKARRALDLGRLGVLKGQQASLDDAVKKAKEADKPKLQAKLEDVNGQVTAAEAKDAESKDAIDHQQDAIAALQAKLPDLEAKLQTTVREINALRIANARLAAEEVEAFRETAVHRPFWYARPYKGSTDPLKRCAIFGYDDSLVLFVRGSKGDVKRVREIVASFDRPAPQARITLHTLQFNGSDAKRLADATGQVEETLNELRGNLTLVQDALRNAISKEVNRQARVTRLALTKGNESPRFSERVYRGFYYPREIREALGLRVRVFDEPGASEVKNFRYRIAAGIDDLEQSLALFKLAASRHEAAMQLTNHAAVKSAMVETENALVAAADSYVRFTEIGSEIYGRPGEAGTAEYETLRGIASELSVFLRSDRSYHDLRDALKPYLDPSSGPPANNECLKVMKAAKSLVADMQGRLSGLGLSGLTTDSRKTAKEKSPFFDNEFVESTEYVTRFTLPDPARGTTLGEMLFVFSLGGQESRTRILRDFSSELLADVRVATSGRGRGAMRQDAMKATEWLRRVSGDAGENAQRRVAAIQALAADSARLYGNPAENTVSKGSQTLFPYFPRTVFGGFSPRAHPGPSEEPMTANQLEILTAIQTRVKSGALAQALALIPQKEGGMEPSIEGDDLRKVRWLTGYLNGLTSDAPAATGMKTIRDEDLSKPFGDTAPQGLQGKSVMGARDARRIVDALRADVAPELVAARVAAADDMIKRFVTVLEDDLQHYLVGPALESARAAVNGRGSQFANYQSTSIIASNRTIARYDASAVATLGQDPNAGVDAAMAAQQIADVVSGIQGGDVARRASGVAPLIGPALLYNRNPNARGDQFLAQGALGLLVGSLLVPDETRKGDVYSLTSGGEFKLTPIFDPSGQALRFNFDYALSTRLLDPLGGQGVELPRVERQSFNTEIQITNLEFRRVAEFSSNTRIGVQERRGGGIPVFKDLPVFRDIPLLGYFLRSRGAPAVRQQTYVFAQTSLYPTVSDIVNLLLASPLRTLPPADPTEKGP